MHKLRLVGNEVWKACNETKQVIEVVVWDASKPEPEGQPALVCERKASSKKVQRLVEEIQKEASDFWITWKADTNVSFFEKD